MNLRSFAKMAWHDVELAAHEVTAVIDYAEKLVAERAVILDIAKLAGVGGPAAVLLGGIELTVEEIEKIKVLARSLAAGHGDVKTPPPEGPPPIPQV